MSDELKIMPIPPLDVLALPVLSAEDEANWLIAHGRITVVTDADGTRRRVPDPWER